MNKLLVGALCVVAAALCLASVCAASGDYYSIAAGDSGLYLMRYDNTGSSIQSYSAMDVSESLALSGVAWDSNTGYVFVADQGANKLIVGFISGATTTPTFHVVKRIDLVNQSGTSMVNTPTSVVVDASGGVYVIGKQWLDDGDKRFGFAHVTRGPGGWSDATVSFGELSNSPMIDVASYSGASAIILHQKTTTGIASHVSRVNGNAPGASIEIGNMAYSPSAVAVNRNFGSQGYAYVVNRVADDAVDGGSLSVIQLGDTPLPVQTYDISGGADYGAIDPNEVVSYTVGDKNYLAILGTSGGVQYGWRIELGSDGRPDFSTKTAAALGNSSAFHQATVSQDGALLWFTNSQTGSATAWLTSQWGTAAAAFDGIGDNVYSITNFSPVPEPSSLIALTGLGLGALARRRRSPRHNCKL